MRKKLNIVLLSVLVLGILLVVWMAWPPPADWAQELPPCPCENPDFQVVQTQDGWARDGHDVSQFHKGASACFRSYPPMLTSQGYSAQQCCYDDEGKLITAGQAAGTPDRVSVCNGEDSDGLMTLRYWGLPGHALKDVVTWFYYGGGNDGWIQYHLYWPPDQGENCADETLGHTPEG